VSIPKSRGLAAPAPRGTKVIRYRAGERLLLGYLTPDPRDGARHPVIVFAHSESGYGVIGELEPLGVLAGTNVVIMAPTLRGDPENPGNAEALFGEVDDLRAAIAHVSALPYVDPARVFVVGDRAGGTLVMLANAAPLEARAVVALGGHVHGAALALARYNLTDRDLELRTPIRFARHLSRPTFFVGDGQRELLEADEMADAAEAAGHEMRVLTCPPAADCSVAARLRWVARAIEREVVGQAFVLEAGQLE
jgi:hypothetical protein